MWELGYCRTDLAECKLDSALLQTVKLDENGTENKEARIHRSTS